MYDFQHLNDANRKMVYYNFQFLEKWQNKSCITIFYKNFYNKLNSHRCASPNSSINIKPLSKINHPRSIKNSYESSIILVLLQYSKISNCSTHKYIRYICHFVYNDVMHIKAISPYAIAGWVSIKIAMLFNWEWDIITHWLYFISRRGRCICYSPETIVLVNNQGIFDIQRYFIGSLYRRLLLSGNRICHLTMPTWLFNDNGWRVALSKRATSLFATLAFSRN